VDDARSALEALCISPQGDSRLQLFRQLLGAALNGVIGSGPFDGFAACNTVCQNSHATASQIDACIGSADAFNQSGDNLPAPFDPPGAADSGPCNAAQATACTVLDPASCAAP
jgi:hypothetical protein